MKTITKKQLHCICCDSPEEYQRQFNEAMSVLADKSPEVQFSQFREYSCNIIYEVEETIFENIADEMKASGLRLYCMDCPYLQMSEDKRIKKHFCPVHEIRHDMNDPACEYFYEKVRSGEAQPVAPDRHKQEVRKMLIEREARKNGATLDEIDEIRSRMRKAEIDRNIPVLPPVDVPEDKPVIRHGSKKQETKTEAARIEAAKLHAKEWRQQHLNAHGVEGLFVQADLFENAAAAVPDQEDNCPEYLRRARAYYQQKSQ